MKTPRRFLFLERFRRRCGVFSLPVVLMALGPMTFLPSGYALPVGGQVVAGHVTTTFNGTQLTLDQASRAAIMNWQQFNIAPNELVRLLQSGPDAAMLARVTGGNPSELLGRLQADGKVFLINPQGILVGTGAIIDTAAFMASTLDVADADFLKGGAMTFQGDSAAGVVNLGRITAREGHVLLIAHTVKNAGEISAAHGTAGLGAGTEVYLASPDAPVFVIKTNLAATPEKTGVDNSGVVAAAQAQLEAAGGSIYDLAVNQSGVIRANGVEHRDGRILITADGGNVLFSGIASARKAGGGGGEILVGGDYQGKNADVANVTRVDVRDTAVLDANATGSTGDGGRVIVWSDLGTRFLGRVEAKAGQLGGDGGFAEVSGRKSLLFAGTADLSAPNGSRGTLLLDPTNLTIVAGTTALPPALQGMPKSWFASDDSGDHTLGADSLTALLATSSVSLYASNSLTVDAPVIVAPGGAAGVELYLSAPTLAINQSISLADVVSGRLTLFGSNQLTTAAGATLSAERIRVAGFPIVALNGPVATNRLVYDMMSPATSFAATNPANAIGTLVVTTDEADPHAVDLSGNLSVHSNSAMAVSALVASAGDVTFSSAGNLTMLGAGADPAAAIHAAGTVTLASTGGVFINNAGAGFLTGAGRRVLYTSATTGAFTLGGLTGYAQFDGVAYPNDPQSGTTLVLYNSAGGGPALVLTITANDFIKLYGQPDPVFTASYAGGTAADLTTLPSFSIQQGTHVNVGTYTIVPSGAASGTHALQYVNGTLRIDPATLTYLANPANRLYGDVNPAFSGTVSGFVNGDTLGGATTGTLTFASPATAASNAGSHAIRGGGLTANHGNYVFQDAVANFSALTVDKAPLIVTFNNATRTYGAVDPLFTASFAGFRNGDTAATLAGFNAASTAHAGSSVGTYQIGGGATAANYALTVVPGTLTITPAPLTLTVNPASFNFGTTTPPTPGYSLTGLVGSDTASLLSGVQFNTGAIGQLAPGEHLVQPSNLGSAQNYVVTNVVPGRFTVTPRSMLIAADSVMSLAGVLPPLTAAAGMAPLPGGPQFSVAATVWRQTPAPGGGFQLTPYDLTRGSPPGEYVLVPHIVPAAGTTLKEVERYYQFTPINGTLTLKPAPVSPPLLSQTYDTTQATLVFDLRNGFTPEEMQKNHSLIDYTTPAPTITLRGMSEPLDAKSWSNVVLDAGDTIMAGLKSLVTLRDSGRKDAAGKPIYNVSYDNSKYSDEEIQFLSDVWNGKISTAQLAERMTSDATVRNMIMPLIVKDLTDAVTAGKGLTQSQSILAARVAKNMNTQREQLKVKLAELHQEHIETVAAAGTNNPFALKTMPDIAMTAQQAVTEQMIAMAVGGVVGGAVGGGVAGVSSIPSVAAAIFPFANISKAGIAAGGAVGMVGTSAAGVIATAVAGIVIGVVGAVMLAQEKANINAYDAAMRRANTPVPVNLLEVDLKGNDIVKGEYYTAFMAALLETKFP